MNQKKIKKSETILGWFLLIGSLVGWPVSVFWLATDEPVFVLSLSWLALTMTAWDIVKTSRVNEEQEKENG